MKVSGLFFFNCWTFKMIPDISHHNPSSMSLGSRTFISPHCCANVKVHISQRLMRILKRDDNDSAIWIFWLKKRSPSKRRHESCQSDVITIVSQQLAQFLLAAWHMVANLFLLFNFDENFMRFSLHLCNVSQFKVHSCWQRFNHRRLPSVCAAGC